MKLFDSHSHLHFHQFNNDREEIINRLNKSGVKVINVGTDLEDSKKAIDLAKKYQDLMWASVGIHPNDISTANRRSSVNSIIEKLKKLAKDKKVIAIGECGLDYFKIKETIIPRTSLLQQSCAERQKEIFEKQIELAKELNKPLILHCHSSAGSQDAYKDTIEILKYKNLNISSGNGAAHFFAGSKETAKKFLDLGFYIGLAGPITFPPKADQPRTGASQYKEIVEFVPIDRILIETDAPFAAPIPHRGKRNEPAYVEFVARKIAEWKKLDFKEVAQQTAKNTQRLFNIKN